MNLGKLNNFLKSLLLYEKTHVIADNVWFEGKIKWPNEHDSVRDSENVTDYKHLVCLLLPNMT